MFNKGATIFPMPRPSSPEMEGDEGAEETALASEKLEEGGSRGEGSDLGVVDDG